MAPKARAISIAQALSERAPRQLAEEELEWEEDVAGTTRLEVVGDSLTVIKWHQGAWTTKHKHHLDRISSTINLLSSWHRGGKLLTRTAASDFHRHVYRELNKRADHLANSVLDGTLVRWSFTLPVAPRKLLVHFDGAKRGTGPAAAAWSVQGELNDGAWAALAEGGVLLTTADSVMDAELTAQEEAVKATLGILEKGRVTWTHNGQVVLLSSTRR